MEMNFILFKKYSSLVFKLLSLGLVITAGGFWSGAGVDSRPKYRDEQTLVGGTVWSQILIPVGLLISKFVGEELDIFIHGYFLVAGVVLLFSTGIFLITVECLSITKQKRIIRELSRIVILQHKTINPPIKYDKIYMCIGILCLIAGCFTLADFMILFI